ncbi:tRNA (adenosine(37)-N6)-threonylcarbamoyltransferase complex ATPase subunit type 1 TsaE [Thermodesulfobacteriota bacterium]
MKGKFYSILSESNLETIRLGKKIGSFLKDGDVIALSGDLGSGKTWFTKGLARGIGIESQTIISSPSFTLVNQYNGRFTLYHMDLYRLESFADILAAGLEEYLHNEGIVVIEWADRWPETQLHPLLKLNFTIIDEHRRGVTLTGIPSRACDIIDSIELDTDVTGKAGAL